MPKSWANIEESSCSSWTKFIRTSTCWSRTLLMELGWRKSPELGMLVCSSKNKDDSCRYTWMISKLHVFQRATEHGNHNWFGELPFHDAKHHHRGQAHKHVCKRRQDDRRRTNRTYRVGALPQSHPGLFGTLVGPGKDTHGTSVPLRKAVGGPRHASRDTRKTTRPRFTAPRLGYPQQWLERSGTWLPCGRNEWGYVDLDEPTSFFDHVYLGCTQRECKPSEIIIDEYRKMFKSRIAAAATEKITRCEPPHAKMVAWSYDMEGHAQMMRWERLRTGLKSLLGWSPFQERGTWISWRIVKSVFENCLEMRVPGTNW